MDKTSNLANLIQWFFKQRWKYLFLIVRLLRLLLLIQNFRLPFSFWLKKIGILVGDLKSLIKPLTRLFSITAFNITNSIWLKLLIEPYKNCQPFNNLIVYLLILMYLRSSIINFDEKKFAKSTYLLETSMTVSSTFKWVIWAFFEGCTLSFILRLILKAAI